MEPDMDEKDGVVARTVNLAHRAVRREAFVDAAARLLQTEGFEKTSIQEILDEVGASRGAFYHYFSSKADLLDAVVARMVEAVTASIEPIIADPTVPAVEKLQRTFGGIADWKGMHREMLVGLLRVWLADENALVRDKLRRGATRELTPIFRRIIAQGMAEGTFAVGSADRTALVLVHLIMGANAEATDLYVAHLDGRIDFATARDRLAAFGDAIERLAGLAGGSLRLVDDAVLQEWFGDAPLAAVVPPGAAAPVSDVIQPAEPATQAIA